MLKPQHHTCPFASVAQAAPVLANLRNMAPTNADEKLGNQAKLFLVDMRTKLDALKLELDRALGVAK